MHLLIQGSLLCEVYLLLLKNEVNDSLCLV